jgi:uncharacterized protein (TIGR02246 family)
MRRDARPHLAAWFLFALTLLPVAASARDTGSPSADETAIRKLVAEQTEAWNRHDAAAWSKDFAPDADFVNIFGGVFQGRAEIEKRHADIFLTLFKDSRTEVTVRRLVFLGKARDVAVVDTDHVVTGHGELPPTLRASGEPAALRTHMKYVMQKVKGRWLIAAGQNTDVKPRPATPPVTPKAGE